MSDGTKAATAIIVEKARKLAMDYLAAVNDIEQAKQYIAGLEARQTQINTAFGECETAARVIGFDLIAAMNAPDERGESQPTVTALPSPTVVPHPSVREAVLAAAQAAYPSPVRATELRAQLEKVRGPLHEKTVGMTLYRLLRDHKMRREGRDWFFIPPDVVETKNPGVGAPGPENRLL